MSWGVEPSGLIPAGRAAGAALRLARVAVFALLAACQSAPPDLDTTAPATGPVAAQVAVPADVQAPPAPGPVDAAPPPAQSAPQALPKSAAQLACEKGGGGWVSVGKTGTLSCQRPLRDGGQQCRRDSDCAGECLARSRTCAPFAPLFGCNEVLQDNGQRVTLCID